VDGNAFEINLINHSETEPRQGSAQNTWGNQTIPKTLLSK